jgi:hypothetical protein
MKSNAAKRAAQTNAKSTVAGGDGPTMSVPAAGRKYFNLARNASYAAAARGEIPCLRIGGRLRAIVAKLDAMVSAE